MAPVAPPLDTQTRRGESRKCRDHFFTARPRPKPEYDDLSSCVSYRDVDWTAAVTTRVDSLWRTALVFPLRAALYAERGAEDVR